MAAGRYVDGVLGRSMGGTTERPSLGEIGLNHFGPYLINRITARWNAVLAEELKAFDLNTSMMRTLGVLSISSSSTINELALLTLTEQSTMSRMLDSMESQGLIERRQREDDMRVRQIHITEKGRILFERFWPIMYGKYRQMLDGISEAEYEAFVATAHRMLRNLYPQDG